MSELSDLRSIWNEKGIDWDHALSLRYAQRAISLSDPRLAINILRRISEPGLNGAEVKYYLTLAHANSGSRQEVFRQLAELMDMVAPKDDIYVSALCLLGRLEKDRFIRLEGQSQSAEALAKALKAYSDAYELSSGSFPGINAATLSFLSGDGVRAMSIAQAIIKTNVADQSEVWRLATLGEAHLICDEMELAIDYYEKFIELCGKDYGTLSSTRKHFNLLAEKLNVPEALFELFDGPRICVFTGHMYDTSKRASPRFPQELGPVVAKKIGEVIDAGNIKIGYCSAASGADLLFANEMIKRDLEVNIVLPFDRDVFRRASVILDGIDQSFEYWAVLDNASSVTIATEESYLGNACLFSYAADLMEGYAKLHANQLNSKVEMLAAIDPYESGLVAGSVDLVGHWVEAGMDVTIVDIAELSGRKLGGGSLAPAAEAGDVRKLDREIKTIVEVVTSQDKAEQIYAALAEKVSGDWQSMFGGGLNKAFNKVSEAAEYAYRLRDEAQLISWLDYDLPADTYIQIALHTGPVAPNTRSKKYEYFGTHVFYARSLAELAPDGCIYLTEPAAALLVTHGPDDYTADFLGEMEVNLKPRQIYRLHKN